MHVHYRHIQKRVRDQRVYVTRYAMLTEKITICLLVYFLLFISAVVDTTLLERTDSLLTTLLRELEAEERQVTGKWFSK